MEQGLYSISGVQFSHALLEGHVDRRTVVIFLASRIEVIAPSRNRLPRELDFYTNLRHVPVKDFSFNALGRFLSR